MKSIIDIENKVVEVLDSYTECNVMISGGADSDIMLNIIEKSRPFVNSQIKYYFVDTGLEYNATKKHIQDLMAIYNIDIEVRKPVKPIPTVVKEYGQPFINKRVSDYINRLQNHNFDFVISTFESQYKKYPHCKAALRWFYNDFEHNKYNIINNKGLQEFMFNNKPDFAISKKCCDLCKKKTLSGLIGLNVIGIRKSEGGNRKDIKSCWNKETDVFYPLLFMDNAMKEVYKKEYNIKYSDCYEVYGLKRTGCAGCPYGRDFENELKIIKKYEPKLYNACNYIFGKSYEYTRKYRKER